ncbi:protein kinase, partial [Achlya hypogyna]
MALLGTFTMLMVVCVSSGQLVIDPNAIMISETMGENYTLTLNCPNAYAITKINFASYGTPSGIGRDAKKSTCDSEASVQVMEENCLKQSSCSVRAVNSVFGDPCVGTGKNLTVTAQCTPAIQTLFKSPNADLATGNVSENGTLLLICQASQVISKILFASYGTPTNVGLYAATGSCNTATSLDIVNKTCISHQACSVFANTATFGDPCRSISKRLTVTAECTTAATSAPSPGESTPIIIGAACGAVLLIGVIIGCVLWRRRQKGPARPTSPVYYNLPSTTNGTGRKLGTHRGSDATGPTGPTEGVPLRARHSFPEAYVPLDIQPLLHHRLMLEDLHVTSKKPMASGAYGEVWLGVYGGKQVAIKRLKNREPTMVQKFIDEIVLMSQMDSDYIVRFVGASWTRPIEIECIVEYMDLGDLRSYLMTTRPTVFTWDRKYDVIQSIVHGLVYLHTFKTPIIHRDLKSRNILMDSTKGTKLTDFGTSRTAEVDDTMTAGIGTYQWMAPEIVAGTSYSAAADVYSFGIVLSEMCTHKVPYSDLRHPKTGKPLQQHYILHEVCEGKLYPTFQGVDVPDWVPDMAMQCLMLNEEDRPTALQLSSMLNQFRPAN